MHIGIGLPTRDGAVSPADLLAWAAAAEEAGFSSLAVMDRVAFPQHEPLITLAAVAGVTSRIRLLTSVVIGPTRETTLLGRQAASLDALSGGRLSLGLGIGIRPDDYAATGEDFTARGRRLDGQLAALRRIWSGAPLEPPSVGAIGARAAHPRGPELLVGGYVPAVAQRIAAHGDGYMAPGGGSDEANAARWADVGAAWAAAGRPGRPRWLGSSYVALGPAAEEQAAAYIRSAYAFDPALAERRLAGIPRTAAAVRELVERQLALGVDEYVFRPCAGDPSLVARLAEVLAAIPGVTAGPAVPRLGER